MPRFITANHAHLLSILHSFQRLLPFCTTTVSDSFANYLVDSLGFSHQQALSASSKLSRYRKVNHFNFQPNANSVLTFFRRYGFNDTHLIKIVNFDPRVLTFNVENTIQPKFKFLLDHGFSNSDLIRLIFVNPKLLLLRTESSISPAFDILRRVMGSDTLVIQVLKKLHSRFFGGVIKHLMSNVDLLTSYGIPIELTRKHILLCPGIFSQNPEKLRERLIRVESKLGIARDAPMFMWGVHLLSGFSEETIESKCRMFKSFGWTQTDVDTLIMKKVKFFTVSDENIRKKLDFLMNELQLRPAYLTSNNAFMTSSLEKRIVPRHQVLLILKEKGLLKRNPSLNSAICMSESCFLDMFVKPFEEVHQVYAKLTSCCLKEQR